MAEEKEQIGFLVSKQAADCFRQMAKHDKRGTSAEFELFIEQVWETHAANPENNHAEQTQQPPAPAAKGKR